MKRKKNASPALADPVLSALSPEEGRRLSALLARLMQAVRLNVRATEAMREDFKKTIRYLLTRGVPLSEIEKRLDPAKLGLFYYEDAENWYALDTAATVYPLSMTRGWMPMFRLSAYLDAPVVPEILQTALTFVIRRFPTFAVTLSRGFFWYYLQSAKQRFAVGEESRRPFTVMKLSRAGSPCLRVIYYKNRISVEFFHLLTDGAGGMVFLKTLLGEYFRLLGIAVPCTHGILDPDEPPKTEESENAFTLAPPAKPAGFSGKFALQLRGALSHQRPHQILHFDLDAEHFSALAREKGATFTALMLTYFFFACKESVESGRGKIQIQVPCNMRRHYPSGTLRNFSMYCILCLAPGEVADFDRVLARISEELKRGTSKEALTRQMVASRKLVASLRFVPLAVKAPIAQRFIPLFSDRILTTTLSNLGRVELPAEIADRVEKFDFVLGTTVENRATCSLITYGRRAVLSIFKATDNPAFEEALLRLLKKDGLSPTVTGSDAHGFHSSLSED